MAGHSNWMSDGEAGSTVIVVVVVAGATVVDGTRLSDGSEEEPADGAVPDPAPLQPEKATATTSAAMRHHGRLRQGW